MKHGKIQLPVFISIFVTVIILVGVFFWFKTRTDSMIENYTHVTLEENARARAATFYTKLDDQLVMLESQCRYFEKINMDDFDNLRKTITSTKGIGSFSIIGVIGKDGRGVDYNGQEVNYVNADFFKYALNGRTVVSGTSVFMPEFKDSLILAVPVVQRLKVEGVIYGIFTKDVLSLLIETSGFSGESACALMTKDGSIIARSENTMILTSRIANFFDLGTSWGLNGSSSVGDIGGLMDAGETITIAYEAGSRSRIAVLTPVGIHDWYFALIIPQSIMTNQSSHITNNVLALEVAVSMSFVLILISVLYLLKNNEIVNKTNEKFRMITNQTQTIVFDYDFVRHRLELTGNIRLFNSEGQEIYENDSIDLLLNLIHDDDAAIVRELKSLKTDIQTSVVREARVKCVDGLYYWYRLSGSIVRDASGIALRFVGNMVNVDDEMNKEQLLQQKADEDQLTGLLNKGAFEARVSRRLAAAKVEDLYAFYIIDLDNFKKVNDSLGHLIGDRVLSDTARKLSLIFSDYDYVGRIGGDEFAAFLMLNEDARKVGDKIIEAKARAVCTKLCETYTDGVKEVRVSASVGVSIYPQHGIKYSELFRNADTVLYNSKSAGKNQYNIFS